MSMQIIIDGSFTDFVLSTCLTGDQALRKIEAQAPDLLITDYGHPGPRPDEILRDLSQTGLTFPLIASSAYLGARPDLQQALLGFPAFPVEFVHKPFHVHELKNAILKCLHLADQPPDARAGDQAPPPPNPKP